eukprot:scaffold2506_cov236-Pinguiococcus_pyrenoidosus.AAC.7
MSDKASILGPRGQGFDKVGGYEQAADDAPFQRAHATVNALERLLGGGEAQPLVPKPWRKAGVAMIFLFPAIGGLLFGVDVGSAGLIVNQLADDEHSGVEWSREVDENAVKSTITSASLLGAFLGSVLVFPLADVLGRRLEMLVGAVLYMAGALLAIMAYMLSDAGGGITLLVLGRVVYGVGIGFSMHGAPSYISEMSPSELRGALVSGKELMIVFGILLGNILGFALEEDEGGWRWIYLFQLCVAVLMYGGVYLLPPSARWLALQGTQVEVLSSLRVVFREEHLGRMAADIGTQVEEARGSQAAAPSNFQALRDLVTNPKLRPQMICGIGVIMLQQITGQPSVLFYTDTIFDDAGLGSWANIVTGTFKLVMTAGAVSLVDHYGRKTLLYVGNTIMAVSAMAVAFAFINYDAENSSPGQRGSIILFLITFIGGYQIGFGPVGWVLISEVFPLEKRGQAISLAVQVNFFLNLIVTFVFLLEAQAIGNTGTFIIYAVLLIYSVYFVYKHVPETKGKSLEEIEAVFRSRSGPPELQEPLAEVEEATAGDTSPRGA